MKTRKKLIEVSLPLEKINEAAAREKSIRHGHPSTLHLWWARRPLAAARAVIFSQMVDDPGEYADELLADAATRARAERELAVRHEAWRERARNQQETAEREGVGGQPINPEPTLTEVAADIERQRLFALIEQFVQWENTTNEPLIEQARAEIRRSWRRTCADNADHPLARELFDPDQLPAFHDPFAGGGALPLEAQRLGLEAHASDLNPVAVLINKAMIEIPPVFAGRPPVNPESRRKAGFSGVWRGAQGLADDVRYYGQWMRDEAQRRIGHLYPPVEVTEEMTRERPDLRPYVGRRLTVIAWIWARTVKSPNPAFAHVDVPLASTYLLSTKQGKEAWVEPVIDGGQYRFTVKVGKPPFWAKDGTKLTRANFRCVMSGAPMSGDYIKAEGRAKRMGARLMAIVAEGDRGRVYLAPTSDQEMAAEQAMPTWRPEGDVPARLTGGTCVPYGLTQWGDLFTHRQLVALSTLSDLVGEVVVRIHRDALAGGLSDDPAPVRSRGTGATAYAEGVALYLSFLVGQVANHSSSLCGWNSVNTQMRSVFARQALPMVWDFAESNVFSDSSGSFNSLFERQVKGFQALGVGRPGEAFQSDVNALAGIRNRVVSTDPPYYDNIGYADLSDFFYVWLRRSERTSFPDILSTLAAPKAEELVASPYRHGGRDQADVFFLDGMSSAMKLIVSQVHPSIPVTIYYAFKQAEADDSTGFASTGWETFLQALMGSGSAILGTWPLRTEKQGRVIGIDANALASSILLVCRPRPDSGGIATRREFVSALKAELPYALAHLQRANIAPVDLAQAAIGPGMAVYSRYVEVVDAEDKPLRVGDALRLINQVLDETLAQQEGDFDPDSRWAVTWFEQHGFEEGDYGEADVLARARVTSVDGMKDAGILTARGGKVRLLTPSELPADWDPTTDTRRPAWESVHHLIRALETSEAAAAALIAKLGADAEVARELAYRLYVIADRKKRATEAGWYNGLVQSFPEAARIARDTASRAPEQQALFGTDSR